MAAKLSESLASLEKDILDQPHQYEFFQAYRLLENVNQTFPVSPRRPARKIEVRPTLSLGYTDQDIHEVRALDKQRGYEIISQLPGLYGVASPLPDFYNEELLDNEWDELEAPREFLDIIHKQLFPKLYQAWRLYKLNLNTIERSQSSYWNLLYSLMGEPNTDSDDIKAIKLRYFSLFSNKERSKDGLLSIVSDFLDIDDLDIKEFEPSFISIKPELRCQLGRLNHQLGDAHLGSKIHTQTLKITIELLNLNQAQYDSIHSNNEKLETLKQLIKHYLKKPLTVDIKLHVNAKHDQLSLGKSWHQLGITTILGQTENNHRSVMVSLLD
ncbi:type VI secretion system baseplate subunit TssG [Pseudomonas sp. HK3]